MSFTNVGPDDNAIYVFCLVAHGYHLASLVRHLASGDPYNSDFEKLLLHHIATNVMMITGNYTGHHRWSAVILILHDGVDIFVCIARIFNSIEGTKNLALWLGYIPLVFIYAYLKLFYFGWLCYANWFISEYPPERAWMQKFMWCHAFLNTSLWVLHIIWYKGVIKIGFSAIFKDVYEDTINKVEKKPSSPASGKTGKVKREKVE